MTEPERGTVAGNGVTLGYAAWGPIEAPVVVLVHGMRDHARSWDPVAQALAPHYRVIAPDLRGHGESGWAGPGGYAMAMYVGDLADVIDGLGLSPVALVSHSLGAAIALRYAGTFPERVRALVAIEGVELPIVRDERAQPVAFPLRLRRWIELERERRDRTPRRYTTPAEAEARMAAEHPTIAAELIAHLVHHGLTGDDAGGWRWKYDNTARYRAPDDADSRDLDAALAAIACPTLLFYGEDSWIPVPPAERLALIRDHRVVRFAGVGHWLHQQRREDFLAAVVPFLENSMKEVQHA